MSKGLIRKYFDVGPAAVATTSVYSGGATGFASGVANAGTAPNLWLTQLTQSDDDQSRIGQSVAIETLDARVQVSPDNTVAGHHKLRYILFADNECDGAIPDQGDVLQDPTVALGATESFLNPGYFGRFNIIEDKIFQWYNSSTANSFQTTEPFTHEVHHDLKSHRVMWDQTNASAIANARKGHIFVMFFYKLTTVAAGGIITIATANPPGIQFNYRFRFRDV